MAFSGNGAGRFQIRRIRNGSTTECLITATGPAFQDFAMPTGQHFPNWDDRQEAADIANHPATTANPAGFAAGTYTEFAGGIYRLVSGGTAATAPTSGQTDENWEFEGPIATPLILKPQILVDGVELTLDGARANSPTNAAITDIEWFLLVPGTAAAGALGDYEPLNATSAGYELITGAQGGLVGSAQWCVRLTRNLDTVSNFQAGALVDNQLHFRARISYNVTGVLDSGNNLQTLTCDAFFTVRRTVLTESSMFSRILLIDIPGQTGSASPIWNSGFRGDKTFRADLILGADIANAADSDPSGNTEDPNFAVTYQWMDSDGAISGETNRTLTITRNDVDTAEVYFCNVTDTHTGITYTTNSIEIRDFLDPIQFVEVGTATVDTGSNGMLQVIPYQNGAPMQGLTASNATFSFEIRQQANATDMTGTRIAWLTGTGGLTAANRFPNSSLGTYVADTNPVLANGIARVGYITTDQGATIEITDAEMGAFGAFIDYDVEFDMVGN